MEVIPRIYTRRLSGIQHPTVNYLLSVFRIWLGLRRV